MNKCQHVTKDKSKTDQQESKSFNFLTSEQRLPTNADGDKITAKFVISLVYRYENFLEPLSLSDGIYYYRP